MRWLQLSAGEVTELPGAPQVLPTGGWLWVDCEYPEARSWVSPVAALTGTTVFDDHLLNAENLQHP